MYAPSDTLRMQRTSQALQSAGYGGLANAPGKGDVKSAINDYKKNLDKFIREEKVALEGKIKNLAKEEASYKKILEQHQKLTKEEQKRVENQEKLKNAQEAYSKAKEDEVDSETKINALLREKQGLLSISDKIKQLPSQFKADPMKAMSTVGEGIGVVTGAVAGLAVAAERLAGFQMRLESAKGSAISQTTGKDISDVYGGRSAFEAQWMTERGQASGLAADKARSNRTTDRALGIASMLGIAGGAAVVGASALGTPFTMGGSALGIPAGLAMMGAGAAGLSNDRNRKGILGGEEYDQLIASQQADDRAKAYEAIKEQDPQKKATLERYEQSYRRDVNTQRTLGINDEELYGEGGLESRAANAGFDRDQAHRMATGIVQAGGSARMGRQGEFGLQMERMGQTNASGILGAISGSVQSPESTKRATISIMSEAFKIGLDNTDFAEENRKFTDAAAGIIQRTGASNEGDQDKIAQTLAQFLGERTNKGVEAAQGAYERFQERGSQVGGRRGAMRLTEAMKSPILSQFSTQDLTELLNARPEDLRKDSAFLQSYALEAKTTPEEILKELSKGTNSARFLIPGRKKKADELKDKLNDYMKKNNMTYSQFTEASRTYDQYGPNKIPDEMEKASGQLQRLISEEEPGKYNASNIEAQEGEFLQGIGAQVLPEDKEETKKKMESTGGRLADEMEKANAAGIDEARKAFVDLTPEIRKAIGAVGDFVTATTTSAGALRGNAAAGRPDLPRGDAMNKDITEPITQTQANKPRGGASESW
ncbi:unnamed protein product [Sphagnum balticum]